jgi:hypothetical protein
LRQLLRGPSTSQTEITKKNRNDYENKVAGKAISHDGHHGRNEDISIDTAAQSKPSHRRSKVVEKASEDKIFVVVTQNLLKSVPPPPPPPRAQTYRETLLLFLPRTRIALPCYRLKGVPKSDQS